MDPAIVGTQLPPFWRGVRKNHVAVQKNFQLASFDTETCYGKVFATSFYDGSEVQTYHGLCKPHLTWLLEKVRQMPQQHTRTTVIAAHNLGFDLSVLLWPVLNPHGLISHRAVPKHIHFSLPTPRCEVEVFFSRPCFARFKFRDKTTIHFIDTFAFFTTSLAKALRIVGGEVQKLGKPDKLGMRVIPMAELRPYVEADTKGAYKLLEYIIELHRKYESRLCVSLPMLAGKIFRHYYMKRDFPKPKAGLIAGSLLSYHGGKNYPVARIGHIVPKADWHKGCYDLDIRSAYPEAMRQLPDFEHGKWLKGEGLKFFKAHPHGIYKIWGEVRECKWGIIFTHDFTRLVGRAKGVWVTGYEVREAVRSGELRLERIEGWGWSQSGSHRSAFSDFVDQFYRLKEGAVTEGERYFYKLILNSLYGKFIQRTPNDEGIPVAGSMFDPSVASLITGYVRAKVHRLEHKYDSIHTATDGLITQKTPDPKDMGPEMGKLKQENFGPCLIIRNKLYLHFDESGKLKKTGLHGFQGTPDALLKMWDSSRKVYTVEKLVKWAQAWHIGLPPGMAYKREMVLRA